MSLDVLEKIDLEKIETRLCGHSETGRRNLDIWYQRAEGKTLREIGGEIGVGPERIRQILAKLDRKINFLREYPSKIGILPPPLIIKTKPKKRRKKKRKAPPRQTVQFHKSSYEEPISQPMWSLREDDEKRVELAHEMLKSMGIDPDSDIR